MWTPRLEAYDPDRHENHMGEVDGIVDPRGQVIVVEVDCYRLEFLSLNQLRRAIDGFEHPSGSTRMERGGGDPWEFQPWMSRLPSALTRRSGRERVLGRLRRALAAFEADADYRPVSGTRPPE